MSRFFSFLPISTIALSSTILISSPAKAVERFGLVCISNPTQLTITYNTHWGDGKWVTTTLLPGQTEMHSWTFAYANQDQTPRLFVIFDSLVGAQKFDMRYQLPVGEAPDQNCAYGNHYQFQYDSIDQRSINLYRS